MEKSSVLMDAPTVWSSVNLISVFLTESLGCAGCLVSDFFSLPASAGVGSCEGNVCSRKDCLFDFFEYS